MKKRTLFKSLGFVSLALLMSVTGVFAFAPLRAVSNGLASANAMDKVNTKTDGENIKYAPSALGLDPKNDPVIYTTVTGLEIKYGGESVNDQLSSGKPLSGYPYFTMGTYNGYAVNWVIIGRNTNDTVFIDKLQSYVYSTWKNTIKNSAPYTTNATYFYNNIYDNTTVAGNAIDIDSSNKAEVIDLIKATKTVVGNDEIPSGCVLAISECCLGYSYFNSSSSHSSTYLSQSNNMNGSRYRYLSDQVNPLSNNVPKFTYTYNNKTPGTLFTYMNNLYSTNLGLSSTQQNLIQPQKLITLYADAYNNAYVEDYSTDGNTLHKLFPLAAFWETADTNNTSSSNPYRPYNNPGTENFCINTYLNTNALRQAYQLGESTYIHYWLRSAEGANPSGCCAIGQDASTSVDGRIDGFWGCYNFGVRPACVVKFS